MQLSTSIKKYVNDYALAQYHDNYLLNYQEVYYQDGPLVKDITRTYELTPQVVSDIKLVTKGTNTYLKVPDNLSTEGKNQLAVLRTYLKVLN